MAQANDLRALPKKDHIHLDHLAAHCDGQRVLAHPEKPMNNPSNAQGGGAIGQAAQDAADKAKDVVAGVKEVAGYAADTGRAYARDAMSWSISLSRLSGSFEARNARN